MPSNSSLTAPNGWAQTAVTTSHSASDGWVTDTATVWAPPVDATTSSSDSNADSATNTGSGSTDSAMDTGSGNGSGTSETVSGAGAAVTSEGASIAMLTSTRSGSVSAAKSASGAQESGSTSGGASRAFHLGGMGGLCGVAVAVVGVFVGAAVVA